PDSGNARQQNATDDGADASRASGAAGPQQNATDGGPGASPRASGLAGPQQNATDSGADAGVALPKDGPCPSPFVCSVGYDFLETCKMYVSGSTDAFEPSCSVDADCRREGLTKASCLIDEGASGLRCQAPADVDPVVAVLASVSSCKSEVDCHTGYRCVQMTFRSCIQFCDP
ncbi:MAG: hypothetical protein JWN04_2722, partial [Myxococcaceae bacterium]|nr:hypothetical protein [Myxococcaceae bacterium]